MNLHEIRRPFNNIAIWMNVIGRNGRGPGTHLWETTETPYNPDHEDTGTMNAWQNRNWWTARIFSYHPFTHTQEAIRVRYFPPLCGRRSTIRNARASWWTNRLCSACEQVARERGMIVGTQETLQTMSPQYQQFRADLARWASEGRPDNWRP